MAENECFRGYTGISLSDRVSSRPSVCVQNTTSCGGIKSHLVTTVVFSMFTKNRDQHSIVLPVTRNTICFFAQMGFKLARIFTTVHCRVYLRKNSQSRCGNTAKTEEIRGGSEVTGRAVSPGAIL